MGITIQLKKIDGILHTRVIEAEGAMKAVRNYANPANAIAYLNKQQLMYKQPPLAEGQVQKGTEITDDDGDAATQYGNIQTAVGLLGGKVAPAPKPAVEPKKDADEPKPEAPPAAPKPGEAKAGEEGEEGKPAAKPATPPVTPPAPTPPPATPPAAPATPPAAGAEAGAKEA